MPLQPLQITYNLPVLPDNDVWWANFAAFNSWFQGVKITFQNSSVVDYTPSAITDSSYEEIDIGGGNSIVLPSKATFDELKTAYINLSTNYLSLRQALINEGVITNA